MDDLTTAEEAEVAEEVITGTQGTHKEAQDSRETAQVWKAAFSIAVTTGKLIVMLQRS